LIKVSFVLLFTQNRGQRYKKQTFKKQTEERRNKVTRKQPISIKLLTHKLILSINMSQIWNINCFKKSTDGGNESYSIPSELVLYYLKDSLNKIVEYGMKDNTISRHAFYPQRFYAIKYCYLHNRFLEKVHEEMIKLKLIDYIKDPHIGYVDNSNITFPFREPRHIMFNISMGEYAGHEEMVRINLNN
jgi:hypothetical protein